MKKARTLSVRLVTAFWWVPSMAFSTSCTSDEIGRFRFVRCDPDVKQDRYVGIEVKDAETTPPADGEFSSIDFQRDGLLLRVPPRWWAASYQSVQLLKYSPSETAGHGELEIEVLDSRGELMRYRILDLPLSCWNLTKNSLDRWKVNAIAESFAPLDS